MTTDPGPPPSASDRSTGVPPAIASAPSPAPRWASLTATFFGMGRMHPGPGTWGSAATVLLWWLITRVIPSHIQFLAALAFAALAIAIGIPAATQMSRWSGLKDPQFVVIDEVAGQLLTLAAVP